MRHLLVDGELLLRGGLEVAGAALVGAPLVVRVLDVVRQVRQPREAHAADGTRGTALVAAVDLEDVLLHHEGVGRPEPAHVAQVQLGAGVRLAVVTAQLVLLK